MVAIVGRPTKSATRTSELPVSADEGLTQLYALHYQSLVRLAALLVDDVGGCEEIVQEAYIRVHQRWNRIDEPVPYLRRTVVNLARSNLRHRQVVRRYPPAPPRDAPGADEGIHAAVARTAIVRALRKLPQRQREAVVLRYYGDLSEADIAAAMGVSPGTVKSSCSRGLDALATQLESLA